jgi:8-oxo-dGTP pyrophosphatase MutT (NUDIX family)
MSDPVPVRPAATVMLVRDTDAGVEVFMMRRTTSAAFASGMYVFPGGRVDTADGAGDEGFAVAAIREAFEEAGVLLARDRSGALLRGDHAAFAERNAVHRGAVGLRELCDRHGLTPCTDELAWVAHWITPVGEAGARRFDTRFFVAAAPSDQLLSHDNHETIASMWVRPADAIERHRAGVLTMMPPTISNLRFLDEHRTVAEVMAAAWLIGTPPAILPKIANGATSRQRNDVLLPGDPGYEDA